jgi:hypothetical protein
VGMVEDTLMGDAEQQYKKYFNSPFIFLIGLWSSEKNPY